MVALSSPLFLGLAPAGATVLTTVLTSSLFTSNVQNDFVNVGTSLPDAVLGINDATGNEGNGSGDNKIFTTTDSVTYPCLTEGGTPASSSAIPQCNLPDGSGSDQGPVSGVDYQDTGSGTLRLTTDDKAQVGATFYSTSFPTAQGLDIKFDTYQWTDSDTQYDYGDGIGFVLAAANPANPAPPATPGPPGGDLGYSSDALGYNTLNGAHDYLNSSISDTSCGSSTTGNCGIPQGYLGFGLDVYGDYSNPAFQGSGCQTTGGTGTGNSLGLQIATASTEYPEAVAVKGPGNGTTGYCLLDSVADNAVGTGGSAEYTSYTNGGTDGYGEAQGSEELSPNSPSDYLDTGNMGWDEGSLDDVTRPSPVEVEVLLNPSTTTSDTMSNPDCGETVLPGYWGMCVLPIMDDGNADTDTSAPVFLSDKLPSDNVSSGGYAPSSWVDPTTGIPKQLTFGWTASTGSAVEIHEVNNLAVQTTNGQLPLLDVQNSDTEGGNSGDPAESIASSTGAYGDSSSPTFTLTPRILSSNAYNGASQGGPENDAVTVTDVLPYNIGTSNAYATSGTDAYGDNWSCGIASLTESAAVSTSTPTVVQLDSTTGIVAGTPVSGTDIPNGTTVSSVSSGSLTLSAGYTGVSSGTETLTFGANQLSCTLTPVSETGTFTTGSDVVLLPSIPSGIVDGTTPVSSPDLPAGDIVQSVGAESGGLYPVTLENTNGADATATGSASIVFGYAPGTTLPAINLYGAVINASSGTLTSTAEISSADGLPATAADSGVANSTSPTQTTVVGSPNPANTNQSVTYTATISSSNPDGGYVNFYDGAVTSGDAISGCQGVAVTTGPSHATAVCSGQSYPAVGTQTIYAVYSGDSNFSGSQGSTPEVIQSSSTPITITASGGTYAYGSSVPTITPALTSGSLLSGDTISSLDLNCTTTATSTSAVSSSPYPSTCVPNVGTETSTSPVIYTVTTSNGTYSVTFDPGSVTETKDLNVPITITASSGAYDYAGTVPTVTGSLTSGALITGDSLLSLGIPTSCSNGGATSTSPIVDSPYTTSCTGPTNPSGVNATYVVTYDTGTITEAPESNVPITITASSGSYAYGGTVPTITGALTSGSLGTGDTLTSLGIPTSCSAGGATSTSSVTGSPYTSSCTGPATKAGVNETYTITYATGTVTETKELNVPITVTASGGTYDYGHAVPTITANLTAGALIAGDTLTSLAIPTSCSAGGATSTSSVSGSPYTSTCTGPGSPSGVNATYVVTYDPGTVTELHEPLTITASSGTNYFGTAPTTPTPSYSGYVNGDSITTVLSSTASCSTTVSATTAVGAYSGANTCSGAVLINPNYTIDYVAGSQTVESLTTNISITALADPSITPAGNPVSLIAQGIPANATGTVTFTSGGSELCSYNVATQSSCPTSTSLPAGPYSVVANYSGNSEYNPASATTSFTLTSAIQPLVATTPLNTPVTLTVPTAGTVTISSQPPVSEGSCSVNPDGSIDFVPATGYSGVAVCDYTLTIGGYTTEPATVTVTVLPAADPTVLHGPQPKTTSPLPTPHGTGPFIYKITEQPPANQGICSINATTGVITFNRKTGYTGTAVCEYAVVDGAGGISQSAKVTILGGVEREAAAGVTPEGTPITLQTKLPSGCSPFKFAVLTHPSASDGSWSFAANGAFTYRPVPGVSGMVSFTYNVTNCVGEVTPGTITIQVGSSGAVIPSAHTGEAWSSPLYWFAMSLVGVLGGTLVLSGRHRRRRA